MIRRKFLKIALIPFAFYFSLFKKLAAEEDLNNFKRKKIGNIYWILSKDD